MSPRLRVLAISLATALTLTTVGCGTEGKADDTAAETEKDATTTTAGDEKVDPGEGEPDDTTTTVDDKGRTDPSIDGESGPYVEAMKRSMQASNEEEGDIHLSDGQIDCLAPRFVNILGADRMKKNGVTPADLESDDAMDFSELNMDEKEGNALYDTFGDCGINIREAMMESFAEDDDMTPAMKGCLEGVFTDDNLRKLMVSTMVNGDDAMENDPKLAPLMGQLMGCAFMGMGDEMGDMDFDLED